MITILRHFANRSMLIINASQIYITQIRQHVRANGINVIANPACAPMVARMVSTCPLVGVSSRLTEIYLNQLKFKYSA